MSIAHDTPGAVKSPPTRHTLTSTPDSTPDNSTLDGHFATLRQATRDTQVRAALAVLNMFVSASNEWTRFTVADMASALTVSPDTINRHLRTLVRRHYLEDRPTHRKHGEREARLNPLLVTPLETPGATR